MLTGAIDLVTAEDLAAAIDECTGVGHEKASRDAEYLMDLFGFTDRIIDNVLEPEDRQLFYMLEEFGLVTTDREETVLPDGREWRTHYWAWRKDRIHDSAGEYRARLAERTGGSVYDGLPDDVWGDRT